LKAPGVGEALVQQLVAAIQEIRKLDLRKAPSIGETIDWAQSLAVLGAPQLDKELIEETISVIAKYDRDAEKILAKVRGTDQPTALERRQHEQHEAGREIWSRHHHHTKPAPGDRYGSL
ncbi:MAG: MoxR family ATPase, partial [Actinobacteria bacterium]|nr:MoxR family ATPase [Actinomycetota bacterium]